jgi:hypothetical protein
VTDEAPDNARSVPPNVPPAQFPHADDEVAQAELRLPAVEPAEAVSADRHDSDQRPEQGAAELQDRLESVEAELQDRLESMATEQPDRRPADPHAADHVHAAAHDPQQGAASHAGQPPDHAQEQTSPPALHTPQVTTTSRSDQATAKAATQKFAARAHE